MHKYLRRIVPIIILGSLAVAAIWYYTRPGKAETVGPLTASGTIEATQVTLASELGGKVIDVLANEGERVQSGDLLVRMDDEGLQAQIHQAETQLALAQANFDLVAAGLPEEQVQVALKVAELDELVANQALDELEEKAGLVAARTLQEIAEFDKALDQASKRVDTLNTASDQADIDAAKAQVIMAKDRLDKAREDYQPYENKPEDNLVRAALLAKMAEAEQRYDQVVQRYNNLSGHSSALDVGLAEANEALVQAQLDDAHTRYEKVQDGPDADNVALVEAQLEVADARKGSALAGPRPEQLAVAQAQVDAAQAAIDLLKTQEGKFSLTAPVSGTVLSRVIEPGEVTLPGAPLLVIANLDELTITIYLPEDRYGEIRLGDSVEVTVDSFPGEAFTARVVQIADQAEFTPRNVQTAEGRKTTVFAVKLALEESDGRLKPGMPADVRF